MIVVEILVKIIGYTVALYGLWRLIGQRLISDTLKLIYRDYRRKRYSKRLQNINSNEGKQKRSNPIHEHISLLLQSVSKAKTEHSPLNFYVLTLFLFGVSYGVINVLLNDLFISGVIALVVMLIPYIIMRMRLTSKRLRTSMAFLNEFHLIVQTYHATGQNGYHLIMNLCKDINDKQLKESFMKLLSVMQRELEEKAFKDAVKIFVYTVKSSFAIRFGNLLIKSYLYQADISLPLKDLNHDISERKQDLDSEKSKMLETKILGYLPIITIPVFLFAAYRMTTLYDFWELFTSHLPIVLFVIAVLFSIFSLFAVIIISKPRSDI